MSSAAETAVAVTRERADEQPRRMAAGRAEWKSLSALADMRPDWQALADRALEPNIFYDPAFALAAAPVFGDPGAVLVWSRTHRLIGFFPARVQRRYGVATTLTGWTHAYAPFGVPLIDRDEADVAIAGFLDHVEANAALPKLVVLPLVASGGAFATALARALLRRGGAMESFGAHERALLQPGDRATYLDHALAHKKTKELRRQRRRLEETGAVTFSETREPEAVAAALADFLSLEASGWKGRQGSAAIEHPAIGSFMQRAVTALAANGQAGVARLTHNGRPIAAAITLRSGNASWFWKIAYDEAFAKSSPGVQLTLDLTEGFLSDESLARIDSCATAGHPMIDHLWRERLPLADLLIAPGRASLAPWRIARHLETLRRVLISTAKTARDRARR